MEVCGRVDLVTEVMHRKGKSAKGNEYDFYQQVVTLALGGHQAEVVYRSDDAPMGPLVDLELDSIVRLRVRNPREFNGSVSFDAV